MKKIVTVVLFALLCPIYLTGQGETANWYFGNGSGIHFNRDGSVSAVEDSSINTFEGCASISDPSGELLFYTDGISVYNRNHLIMENGRRLLGDNSSTQSALIVPKPEDPFLYYIFTVDTKPFFEDVDLGLNYSVVDIRLDGGLGAVTEKNINLLQDCSEKITAVVKDCFDRSIWVLAFASENGNITRFNTFHAFEVNALGVQTTAVKSQIEGLPIQDPRGYLKFSPDGNYLASANMSEGLYLYDFDAVTGLVSGGRKLELPERSSSPYGVEFSPNNRFLYAHSSNGLLANVGHWSSLVQFDLESADPQEEMVILHQGPIFRGALQLGENGKIYRTLAKNYTDGSPFLGVINKPNLKGLEASYEHEAIDLGGKNATQGLPPFIQSFFGGSGLVKNPDGTTSNSLARCTGEAFTLEAEAHPGATYLWQKDGVLLTEVAGPVYELLNPRVEDSGRYQVEILLPDPDECPILSKAQVSVLPIPDPVLELTLCDLDASNSIDGLTEINLTEIDKDPNIEFSLYESSSDRDNDLPIPDPTQYRNTRAFNQTLYYKAVNVLGCTSYGQLNVEVNPVDIVPSAFGPFYQCDEDPEDDILKASFSLDEIARNYGTTDIRFYRSLRDAANQENALDGALDTTPVTLYARLGNREECQGVEEIVLNVNPAPIPKMEATYSLCTDGTGVSVTAPAGFDFYRWIQASGGESRQIAEGRDVWITELGDYVLEAGFNYTLDDVVLSCPKQTSFTVIPSNKAVIGDILISDFSTNNTVEVLATGDGNYEYSLNGVDFQGSSFFERVEPGFLTVYVRDRGGCGVTEKEISVLGYPKFFTPNGDGVNDYWQISGVSDLFEPDAFIAIYDRYGTFVTQIRPEEQGWNGNSATRSLPASDYWFKVLLKDGREVTGHFALKR